MAEPTTVADREWTELLGKIRSGDLLALDDLYDSWGPFVYGLALAVTASTAAATEITYDVFMRIWTEPDQVDLAESTLRARLAVLTHARAVRPTPPGCLTPAARSAAGSVRTQDGIGGLTDGQQLALALDRASRMRGAAGLHPQQCLALALTYLGGQKIGAAARVLGLSRSTVLGQLDAGLRLLSARQFEDGSLRT